MNNMLKGLGLFLLFSFFALVLYANVRRPSLTEQIAPVHLKIFSLDRAVEPQEIEDIKTALYGQPSVTAVGFSKDAKTFSVTYRPDACGPSLLNSVASLHGRLKVVEKEFPITPACPVPPLYGLKLEVLNALRFF